MTLAYVGAIVATVLALIATWTGLVISVALLLPKQTERASSSLTRSPGACFGAGLAMAFVLIVLGIFARIPNPAIKLIGGAGMLLLGAVLIVGAAGTATMMASRVDAMSGGATTKFGSLVRGSVVYSLAMGFPLIGWLMFVPFAIVFGLGAGALSLVSTRDAVSGAFVPTPEYDIADRRGAV